MASSASICLRNQIDRFVLPGFPKIEFGFAYGSGVFRQQDNEKKDSTMVDFIFSVKDSRQWHAENLILNPSHYALLPRICGPSLVKAIQDIGDAKIYFNPYARLPGMPQPLKYGVVEHSHLLDDLQHWKSLYFAGRLHKPVHFMVKNADAEQLIRKNRIAAIKVAAILAQSQIGRPASEISDLTLFQHIAAISYTGDIRMRVGAEHPNKASNIVLGHLEDWRELYGPLINELQPCGIHTSPDHRIISFESVSLSSIHDDLPGGLRHEIDKVTAHTKNDVEVLTTALTNIISRSTLVQTLKGVLTAGISPSIRYLLAKLSKRKSK